MKLRWNASALAGVSLMSTPRKATPAGLNARASEASLGASARQGVHHDPYFVQKIVNREGVTIFDAAPTGDRVLDPDVASCVT